MEPEEVLIDGARHATEAIGRLWRRRDAGRGDGNEVLLDDQQDRLRLLIAAALGVELPIRVAQPPAPPTLLRRLLLRLPRGLILTTALPATDGRHLFLPRRLPALDPLPPARLFRLLALQQAVRALRLAELPRFPRIDSELAQALFLLAEAAAADCRLQREFPGLAADAIALRAAVLRRRPAVGQLTEPERAAEELYRQLLRGAPALPVEGGAAASLAWAEQTAARIGRTAAGRFRLLLPDLWLGVAPPDAPVAPMPAAAADTASPEKPRTGKLPRRPEVREERDDEDDRHDGIWMLQMDDPQQHVEDPMGLQRPADRDEAADPDELGDSLSELAQARLVTTPEPAKEILVSDDPPDRRTPVRPSAIDVGIRYPEWDYRLGAYRTDGVVVRVRTPQLGSHDWVERVMAARRAELDAVHRRFQGLRPRRQRLARQASGEEIDLDACVAALADLRAGHLPDERLYQAVRPARRDIAIALLIDVSGSTDAWVSEQLRIIDIEKEALLVVCRALDALGDGYTIQAFSGEGPRRVDVWPLKDFDERDIAIVRRRIAALEPEQYTRAGAAIRHVTTQLAGRREQQRLLLMLSDGKPNDVDEYEGRYGAEDMRQAVLEARLQGIHCFCLTVDRQAPAYLDGIFGAGRYAVLRHPQTLPAVLVDALRHLLRH